jgi:alanyl aminopeptidase
MIVATEAHVHLAVSLRCVLGSAVCVALAVGCMGRPPQAPKPVAAPAPEAPPQGKLPRDVRPLSYTLELEIVPSRERFSGRTQIRVELTKPAKHIWLHGKNLDVKSVRAQGTGGAVSGSYRQIDGDGLARIEFTDELPAGQAVLELSYDAPYDRQLSGLYKVESGGEAYAFTQFEPVSARLAFPCFDEPAFKTPFDVWLTVQADHVVVGNGPEIASEAGDGGLRRVHLQSTPPLPTYLVAFAVGPLDVVEAPPIPPNDVRKTPLPLRAIAARGKGERLSYALAHTPPLLAELERYFAIPYPYAKLDLIAVPDFGAGAMENAGAITFREYLLLIDEATATESQLRSFANVTAHELAHHWFGNLVTMPWWDDIWLNEAFATWMAARTVAAVHPEHKAQVALRASVLNVMDGDSRVAARRIRQPIESTHDIANAFDGITYQKGAGVLAMFERWLGLPTMRAGIQAYVRAHAHGSADASDLLSALSRAAGKDVGGAVGTFLDQPGVPWIETELRCSDRSKPPEVVLKQSRYLPAGSAGNRAQLWQLPVCLRYQTGGQSYETCGLLAEPEATVPLQGKGCPDFLIPNADGAGYYRWSLPPAALEAMRRNGWSRLTTGEKLSFADSLRAGFASGAIAADTALGMLPTLAADAERNVAVAPMELLRFSREYLLSPAERPALDRYAGKLYQPRLRKLGWQERANEDGDSKLLRAEVASFLAHVARDAGVRAKAAELGRRYLGAGVKARPESVADDLRGLAVQVAVQEGDEALFDAVYQRLIQSQDPVERDRMLVALALVLDERSGRARGLVLDPALRVNEVLTPLRVQAGQEDTREAAWQYLEQNIDAIVGRISPTRAGGLPGMATPFCSKAMADRVQAFFAPRIQQLRGGPRSLAATVEALTLCATQADMQRPSAQAFFAK